MRYYGLFDDQGNRITTYAEGLHTAIPAEAVSITEEEQALYITGNYIRDMQTGLSVLKPQEPPSPAEIQASLVAAVQAHMDTMARARGYDNLLSAVTYADESAVPQFQAEGIAFRAWRSQVWAYCYAQLAAIQQGIRLTVPTAEELIAELPALVLPA